MGLLGRSPAATADEPMRLLLLALLACCACAAGASICDTANCGKGNCTETPGPIPGLSTYYKCDCDPGWSPALKAFPFSPCIVPDCPYQGDCFSNLSLPLPIGIPKDVCATVSCGAGGACKTTGDLPFSYSCECHPGYANLLNITSLPCVKNCSFDKDCSPALGFGPAPAPEPVTASTSHSTSPAPTTGGHDSSGTSAPPSSTKGSVPLRRLHQLLLLVTLAMAHVM